MMHSDYYAICSNCRAKTGKFSSKRGLQKRLKKDGWKSGLTRTLCPGCNDDYDGEFTECECSECGIGNNKRSVGVECDFHDCDGTMEAV